MPSLFGYKNNYSQFSKKSKINQYIIFFINQKIRYLLAKHLALIQNAKLAKYY